MRIIFAGTSDFALPAFQALVQSKHAICAVFTNPDRPAGRGRKLTTSVVKLFATSHNLEVHQPESFRNPKVQQLVRDLQADVFIDVAYGLLIPKEVLAIPKFGCINIHPSLLPRWRGAAPIARAIIAGDKVTGVTIMRMDEGLDTGAILKQQSFNLENTDTTASVLEKTAKIGAELLLEVLDKIENNTVHLLTQDNNLATYASKISKEDGMLNWQLRAVELERMVRAFNPWPVAFTVINDANVRIWQALALPSYAASEPGTIIAVSENGIDIATGEGVLRLLKIQLPGKKALPIKDVLHGQWGQVLTTDIKVGTGNRVKV